MQTETLSVEKDGIDHINIYSKGKTTLGRFLSHFTYWPIETVDGEFNSVEAYWYWLGTESPLKEGLRRLSGSEAKRLGRGMKDKAPRHDPDFEHKIKEANLTKLMTAPDMLWELVDCKLPLVHHYVFDGKVCELPQFDWIPAYFETFKGRRDIWDWHKAGFWAVITTNMQVRGDGSAAMGAGLAKQAATRFPQVPVDYGKDLREGGTGFMICKEPRLILVPTKVHWKNASTMELVERATAALSLLADHRHLGRIALPPLGCGLGGLRWASVKPILEGLPANKFLLLPPSANSSETGR